MRNLYLLLLCLAASALHAQTTYTWNVASGDWTTAASWTPARNTPATNDILVFNGSVTANATATNIPKQTIGKLRLINSVNVRLVAGARTPATGTIARSGSSVTGTGTAFTTELTIGDLVHHTASGTFTGEVVSIASNTSMMVSSSGTVAAGTIYSTATSLNVGDGSNTALEITPGSTLTMGDVSPAESMVLRVLSGSKASIEGSVRMLYGRSRLAGVDSASILVKSGAYIKTDSSYNGNPFLAGGGANTVIFQANSGFEQVSGANPFALVSPLSKVYFEKGSRYYLSTAQTPSISGRNFGTLIFNVSVPTPVVALQNNTGSCDSIIVQQGAFTVSSSGTTNINHIAINGGVFTLNATAGNVNITGNTNIAAAGRLNLTGKFATNPANINFRGAVQQKLSGTGSLRIATSADSAVRFRLQNNQGLLLERSIDLNNAYLDLDSGTLSMNNNTITLGSNTLQGRATKTLGIVSGPGTLTKWYPAGTLLAGDSTLFPVGGSGTQFPMWVFGTATSAGTVSLNSFAINGLSTNFPAAYYDTATSAGIMVNSRFGHAWTVATGNGLAGSNFNIRIGATVSANQVTDVTGMRVTLANGIAPGTLSEDGSGTVLNPVAGRMGLTAAQLNNTFYMGSNNSVNPLPVTFINVSAQVAGKNNIVSWSTASESNLSRLEIEKATDGKTFTAIGMVRATNTKSVQQYSFLDSEGGSASYRIKGVNRDGSGEYSRIVSVTAGTPKAEVTIFPNPVKDYIQLNTVTDYAHVRIYNGIGKEMPFTVSANGINLQDLMPGIYYLHVSENNSTEIVKFVKQD